MLKHYVTGTRGIVAAACVLTMSLIGPSGAQQQGGGGAAPGAGAGAGPTGGSGRSSGMTNRSGGSAVSRRTASSPRVGGGQRNRRLAARHRSRPRVGFNIGFGFSGGCGELRHRARVTGSPHWWRRYRACRRGW
jgi:hypothetical protein